MVAGGTLGQVYNATTLLIWLFIWPPSEEPWWEQIVTLLCTLPVSLSLFAQRAGSCNWILWWFRDPVACRRPYLVRLWLASTLPRVRIDRIGRQVPSKKVAMQRPEIPPARIPEVAMQGLAGMTSTCRACEKDRCETAVRHTEWKSNYKPASQSSLMCALAIISISHRVNCALMQ